MKEEVDRTYINRTGTKVKVSERKVQRDEEILRDKEVIEELSSCISN